MLPFYQQELSTSCVAACVRMALGYDFSEPEIRSRCGHTKAGMRLNQIKSCLADLPLTVEYHIDWNPDDLKNAIRKSIFPIAGIDLRPIEGQFAFHAVVVSKISRDYIVVLDPLYKKGNRKIGMAAFEAGWINAEREAVTITVLT